MIQTLEDTFYIQPLPSHLIRKNEVKEGQPHVIYRRSIEEFSSDYHVSGKSPLTAVVVTIYYCNNVQLSLL